MSCIFFDKHTRMSCIILVSIPKIVIRVRIYKGTGGFDALTFYYRISCFFFSHTVSNCLCKLDYLTIFCWFGFFYIMISSKRFEFMNTDYCCIFFYISTKIKDKENKKEYKRDG